MGNRTGVLLSGLSLISFGNQVYKSLEEELRDTESKLLEVQCDSVSDESKSKFNAAVYQDAFRGHHASFY